MKKSVIIFFFAFLSTISLSFGATLNSMTQDQVKEAFVNKTSASIPVVRLNGHPVMSNTVSVFLDDQGKILGKFSRKPSEGPKTDKGAYTLKDDGVLCITWEHWNEGKEVCVNSYNAENAYVIVDNTNVFHTAFLKEKTKSGNHLK